MRSFGRDSGTVTRKSDALAKRVAALLPKFRASGYFLYHRDPILMMRGFAFDMAPGGTVIIGRTCFDGTVGFTGMP